MPNFVIDPLLVTTPEAGSSQDVLVQWLSALDTWVNEAESSTFSWRHFLACTHILYILNRFPDFRALQQILLSCNDLNINIAALSRSITSFFGDETHDIDTISRTQSVVLDPDVADIEPDELLLRNDLRVRTELVISLLRLACDRSIGNELATATHMVTLPFIAPTRTIRVSGTVGLIEPEEVGSTLIGSSLNEHIPAVFSPGDLTRVLSAIDIWRGGPTEFQRAVERLAVSLSPSNVLSSRLHARFWQSLENSTIYTDENALDKLIRLCAHILTNTIPQGADRRPLRISETPDTSQRTRLRDGASAWRLTITTAGIGWRLHYWHIPPHPPDETESIELADIRRKHDPEKISE